MFTFIVVALIVLVLLGVVLDGDPFLVFTAIAEAIDPHPYLD